MRARAHPSQGAVTLLEATISEASQELKTQLAFKSSEPLTPIPENLSPPQAPAPKTSDSIKLFEFRTPEVTPMWGACVGSEARHLIDCKLLLTSFRMVMVVGGCASIVA